MTKQFIELKMKIFKIIIILGQILFLFLYNFYCYTNRTNHTAVDFMLWAIISLLLGVLILLVSKFKPTIIRITDKLIIFILVLSILTSINIFLFDHFNVMVEYSKWTEERNMPSKPFWRNYKHH